MLESFDLMTSGNEEFLALHDQLNWVLTRLDDGQGEGDIDWQELRSYVRQLTAFYLDNR